MKLVTFQDIPGSDRFRIGVLVSENEIVDLTSLVSEHDLAANDLLQCFDLDRQFFDNARAFVANGNSGESVDRRIARIALPVPRPGKQSVWPFHACLWVPATYVRLDQ